MFFLVNVNCPVGVHVFVGEVRAASTAKAPPTATANAKKGEGGISSGTHIVALVYGIWFSTEFSAFHHIVDLIIAIWGLLGIGFGNDIFQCLTHFVTVVLLGIDVLERFVFDIREPGNTVVRFILTASKGVVADIQDRNVSFGVCIPLDFGKAVHEVVVSIFYALNRMCHDYKNFPKRKAW